MLMALTLHCNAPYYNNSKSCCQNKLFLWRTI